MTSALTDYLCFLTETAGFRAADPDRGGAPHAGGRRLPRTHQAAAHKSRGESAEEDPQEDQKQGRKSQHVILESQNYLYSVNSLFS